MLLSFPVFPSPPQTPPLHHQLPLTTVWFLPSPTKSSTSTLSTGRRCSAGENFPFQSISVTLTGKKPVGKFVVKRASIPMKPTCITPSAPLPPPPDPHSLFLWFITPESQHLFWFQDWLECETVSLVPAGS